MDEDRPVLLKIAEKYDAVLAGHVYCVSNRSKENPHPLSDESEQAWFTENLPDLKQFGVGEFRKTISKNG